TGAGTRERRQKHGTRAREVGKITLPPRIGPAALLDDSIAEIGRRNKPLRSRFTGSRSRLFHGEQIAILGADGTPRRSLCFRQGALHSIVKRLADTIKRMLQIRVGRATSGRCKTGSEVLICPSGYRLAATYRVHNVIRDA